LGYQHQGQELRVLLDNAQKVYDTTIPKVRAYNAEKAAEKAAAKKAA
jgi:hypothetical protein